MASQTAVEWYRKKCFSSWSIAFSYGVAIDSKRVTEKEESECFPLFVFIYRLTMLP